MSKREKFVEFLKTVTPKEFLMDLADGGNPSEADLKLINETREIGLNDEVINVLFHYIMLKTDMRLNGNYVLKVASHWKRKEIKTVEQAMDLAKFENDRYKEWEKQYKINQNKVDTARQVAIETAVNNPNMTDEKLGKLVRNMFVAE